ncbi:MAG: hypothetical protein HFI74_01305 [Lachnospiraceae bacterium]|jgi:hypothetical protein|nr:hypothetical protein [Lachnospiraceae bacterium]
MKNEKKICFILCCNNQQYQDECISYLKELEIPGEEYEIEILPVIGAKSMAAGYNQGMRQTDAKYKVYLHQDVMIWNRHFLYDLLEIFSNKEIGVFGVLGGIDIPDNGILYPAWNVGATYACDTQDAGIKQGRNPQPDSCQEVEALDGMLMATQYDISWREDLFTEWDFYDISQSFEFRKKGYLVVVPYQKEPWCMHDCGRTKLHNYDQGRRVLLQEYATFFRNPTYRKEDFSFNQELKDLYEKLKVTIIQFMVQGEIHSAMQCCEQYDDASIMDSDLSILKKLVSVCDAEMQLYGNCYTWGLGESYEFVSERYHRAKFLLWRIELRQSEGMEWQKEELKQNNYSIPLLIMVGIHNIFHFEKLLCLLTDIAEEEKRIADLEYLAFIAKHIGA